MGSRWLLSGLLVCTSILTSVAQTTDVYLPGFTYREVAENICDSTNHLCHYNKSVSWNDSQIGEYTYRRLSGINVTEFMNWRMVFPPDFDSTRTEPYPVILMLHGGGESGRKWGGTAYATTDVRFDNNGMNVIHGGQAHLDAVNRNPNLSNAFPGIVIWPQVSYNGAWENGWDNSNLSQNGRMTAQIVEWVIQHYNGDPDRVAVHGLSNGAKGSWDIAAKRPDLFAAVLPMSGVGSDLAPMADVLVTTPLWLFQGGTDTNPRPQAAVDWIAGLQQIGGIPRYTYYPTTGHGTWYAAYAEPDFFPWILSKNKKNIYVFGGDPSICPGGELKLGFSANMEEYIWTFNGEEIDGSNDRFFYANQAGTYTVKYKRRFLPNLVSGEWWGESNPVIINNATASSFKPSLTNTGSIFLPILRPATPYVAGPPSTGGMGNDNRIVFTTELGYSEYYWYRKVGAADTVLVQTTGENINTRTVSNNAGYASDAGIYTVKVKLPTGCVSKASDGITINWVNPQTATPQPSRPTMTATNSTESVITWPDLASEVGYEVWRLRYTCAPICPTDYSFEGWTLIKVLPANITAFSDTGLRPQATYRYVIRALQASGGATFSEEPYVVMTTLQDLIPPTAPTNLVASNITDTAVTLTWDPSSDNDRVYKYEVYNGSTLLTTITGGFEALVAPATTFTVTSLEPNTINLLNVRAVDWRGNYSPFGNGVSISTQKFAQGLDYKYYQLSGSTLPLLTTFNFNQEPTRIGQTAVSSSNFILSGLSNVGTLTSPYILSVEGYLLISTVGTYTFQLQSNDGSILYLDLDGNGYSMIINNDGQRSSTFTSTAVAINFTSTGRFPIKVDYSQIAGGSAALNVRWDLPGGTITYGNIPTANLSRLDRTIYYLKVGTPGDNPSATSAWTTNSNGANSATAPITAFSDAQRYFVIANRPTVTITSPLTITGSGSKVIVGTGSSTAITLNLDEALNATLEANQNAIVNVNYATLPKFGVLHATSMVNFNLGGSVNIPNAVYGSVTLNNAAYSLPLSNTTVQGNLTIANGVTTSGIATNLSTLRVGGNLVINNTSSNPFPVSGPNQYSLVFTGGTTHTVSFATSVNPTLFSIQADFGDVVNFPTLNNQTFTVGSSQGGGLTLKGGAKLNLGNNNLIVTGRGTINNNNETGALSMKGGDLTLTTTATQNNSLYFNSGDSVRNLTTSTPVANRASILTTLNVTNLVTVNGGELNAGEGYLVLRSLSDAGTGTARIAPLLNGAKVTGKINAQRYMSGEGRIYRYISSPVKGITAATLQNYFPITGNFTGTSTNYTPPVTTNTSMWSYSEPAPANGYVPFPSNGGSNQELLASGKGYSAFIRQASAPTVMQMVGEPYQGTIDFALTGGTGSNLNGWNLLGNPYAAPIKWTGGSTGWSMSGVSTTAYVIDNSGGTTVVKSHNGISGTNSWNGVIAPGQAFWVRTTSLTPTLSVNENAKQITDGEFYREGGGADNTLEIIMSNATSQDAAIIQLIDGATPAFDTTIDGVKRNNSYFNLSTLSTDNKPLVINQTTTNYCAQEIKLHIDNAAVGTYGIAINGLSSLISGDKVTLIDTFLQTEKVISESENLSFTITSDAASKADGRFTLRFEKPEVVLNQILKSSPACEQSTALVLVGNSQPGVSYQAFFNGAPVTEVLTSTGGTLEIPVNSALVGFGTTTLNVKGGFKGCNSFDLPMQVAVTRDTLTQPEIIKEPLKLIASTEAANYQWYFNGEIMNGQTARELLVPKDGLYFVEVTLSSCSKVSDTVSYVVTGIEKFNRAYQLYPNPTRDKVIVTLEQPINFESLRVISSVGQVLTAPVTQLSAESAEVDFINLPTGLYILQVNGHRYRVLKE